MRRVGLNRVTRRVRLSPYRLFRLQRCFHLPKGIGLYTSFFTLPPGGSSDSEGRGGLLLVRCSLFRCLHTLGPPRSSPRDPPGGRVKAQPFPSSQSHFWLRSHLEFNTSPIGLGRSLALPITDLRHLCGTTSPLRGGGEGAQQTPVDAIIVSQPKSGFFATPA